MQERVQNAGRRKNEWKVGIEPEVERPLLESWRAMLLQCSDPQFSQQPETVEDPCLRDLAPPSSDKAWEDFFRRKECSGVE